MQIYSFFLTLKRSIPPQQLHHQRCSSVSLPDRTHASSSSQYFGLLTQMWSTTWKSATETFKEVEQNKREQTDVNVNVTMKRAHPGCQMEKNHLTMSLFCPPPLLFWHHVIVKVTEHQTEEGGGELKTSHREKRVQKRLKLTFDGRAAAASSFGGSGARTVRVAAGRAPHEGRGGI